MTIEGKCYTYYNVTISIVFLLLGLVYLKINLHRLSFFEVGHMYITLLMNIVASARAIIISLSLSYRLLALKFFTEIHLFHHRNKSEFAMQVHKKIHRISHYFSVYIIFVLLGTWVIFNATPMYNNYALGKYERRDQANVTFELAVYFWMPFDFETDFNLYVYTNVVGWYVSYLCGSAIIVIDLFLSLMIFHMWGHFMILINDLETFPKPGSVTGMYSDREKSDVINKLKECIQYHQLIAGFINEISNIFGKVLLVYLIYYQVVGCLLLLECSQKNTQALVRYVPLTVLMFQQLIQVSLIFETIGTVSGRLKDVVYCMPWECMDSRCRRSVLLLLLNVQEPIHVKAGGLVNVGVTTMASIIKTSFSYFAFLRTANK